MTIYDFTYITAGKFSFFVDFQFVGIYIVNSPASLQVFAEISESAREDGYFIATAFQHFHQSVGTFGDRQMFCYVLHHTHIQSLQQGHTARKTLFEVYFSAHGTLGNGFHLIAYACPNGQFVNTFRLDKRGIHIEANQSSHPSEHIIPLEREVHIKFA